MIARLLLALAFFSLVPLSARAKGPPRSPIDPQSAAFLAAINAPSRPVRAPGGSELRLWGRMLFAELPDWDPSVDLHKIRTRWHQTTGPAAKLQDPEGTKSIARLPDVTNPTRLEFQVVLTNASGSVTRTLLVDVEPPS